MKKLFTLLMLCFSIGMFAASTVNVSFKLRAIDTTGTAIDKTDGVYIVGDFTDWKFRPMEDLGEHIYQFDTTLTPKDTGMYYFILVNSWDSVGNGDWNYYKKFREYPDTANAICNPFYAKWKGDRWAIIPSKDTVMYVSWGVCGTYSAPTTSVITENVSNSDVYPNPSTGIINLKLSDLKGSSKVEIFDLTGKSIRSLTTSQKQLTIDISNQPAGVYILRTTGNGVSKTSKILLK